MAVHLLNSETTQQDIISSSMDVSTLPMSTHNSDLPSPVEDSTPRLNGAFQSNEPHANARDMGQSATQQGTSPHQSAVPERAAPQVAANTSRRTVVHSGIEARQAGNGRQELSESRAIASLSSSSVLLSYYGSEHLAGTTQSEFDVQQRAQRGEKTAEEKTEEAIVLAYVKKQSLLEEHHRSKGKSRAPPMEGEHDAELQRALALSMQDGR